MIEDGLPPELLVPQEERDAAWKGSRPRPTIDFADGKKPAKPTDPGTVALLEERKAMAKAEEKAKRAAAKESRIIAAKRRLKPADAAEKQESEMMTKAAKAGPAPAKKKAKADSPRSKAKASHQARSGNVRPGTKLEIVVRLLTRKEGCTTADILKATDWPAVSVPQQAKAAGLTLRKEKDGNVTRYWAS